MRRLALIVPLCVACSRPNPDFNLRLTAADESSTDTDDPTTASSRDLPGTSGDGDGEPTGDGDGDGEPTGDGDGDAACAQQLTDGLALQFGGPDNFGGQCANGISGTQKVVAAGNGSLTLQVCDMGCAYPCTGSLLSLSTFPLLIDTHVPLGACVSVEAKPPVFETPNACSWSAVTLWDALTSTPYLIATTHASPPTPKGVELLADTIPAPVEDFSCNCEAVGQGNDCCYLADPPAFYYYPLPEGDVYPGGYAKLALSNPLGLQEFFKLYQAQDVTTCEIQGLQTSWAVVPEL